MKKSVIRYSASISAAALFAALSIGGAAFASGGDDDDDEDEEDEDDDEIVRDICTSPNDFESAIAKEVNHSPAVKKADENLSKAEKNYQKAVKAEATALIKLNKAKAQKGKGHATQVAKAQAVYNAAVAASASALVAYDAKLAIYNDLSTSTEASVRSRFNADCGIVDPTPTDTATPTPTDTTTPTPVVLDAPTGLTAGTATSLNTGAFRLKWNAVTGATSYKILRDGVQIGTSTTTTFTPSSSTLSSLKSYTVIATDGTVDSPASAAVSASPYQGTSVADKKGLVTYGQIQVSIAVTDHRITGCWATYPTNSDSGSINKNAIPKYCAEAISLQSAAVSNISGASATWTAFKTSLQAALTAAGI